MNSNKEFFSAPEVAKILGISRIAVFKKIKKGEVVAEKVGRNFVVSRNEVFKLLGTVLSDEEKERIERAVKKATTEYGKAFRLLGKE